MGVRSSYSTIAMHNNRKTCDKHVDSCDGEMTLNNYKNMSYCLFDLLFAANLLASYFVDYLNRKLFFLSFSFNNQAFYSLRSPACA